MDPRIFSVEEANRFIPRIQSLLKELRALREKIEAKKLEMDLLEIVSASRHEHASREVGMSREMTELNELAGRFNKHLEELEDGGGQLKDLDQGLIDFFSVRDGQLVYLCWKEGEETVQYWHTLDGGFQGRKPL